MWGSHLAEPWSLWSHDLITWYCYGHSGQWHQLRSLVPTHPLVVATLSPLCMWGCVVVAGGAQCAGGALQTVACQLWHGAELCPASSLHCCQLGGKAGTRPTLPPEAGLHHPPHPHHHLTLPPCHVNWLQHLDTSISHHKYIARGPKGLSH